MPSFDVVCKVDMQEVDNALNQVMKEIGQRYDFRGSKSAVVLEKEGIKLTADDDFKANAMLDMVRQKLSKRGVDLKVLDVGEFETAAGSSVRCLIKLKQGIAGDDAKKITKLVKELPIKVQTQIQDEQVRVTGKKRDDLQAVMAALRANPDLELPLQFTNFKD